MSEEEPAVVPILKCPSCGSKVKVSPRVAPGRSWLAVLPCGRCNNYAAYMITEEGMPRAWLLKTSLDEAAAAG